jgi:hypothetical protein
MGQEASAFAGPEQFPSSSMGTVAAATATSHRTPPRRDKGSEDWETPGEEKSQTRSRRSSSWGHFFDESASSGGGDNHSLGQHITSLPGTTLQRAHSLQPAVAEPPTYILESTLGTQLLWYDTAAKRPQQPEIERAYYEQLWAENLRQSEVEGIEKAPLKAEDAPEKDFNGEIVGRFTSRYSLGVSKTFGFEGGRDPIGRLRSGTWSSVTIQLPRIRIISVDTALGKQSHAEFLVVAGLRRPDHSSHVTLGTWRRHQHFVDLARQLSRAASSGGTGFKNAQLSWECLMNRKRWGRCLDADYLSLKAFLLERFLHDVLFESPDVGLLESFLELGLVSNAASLATPSETETQTGAAGVKMTLGAG